MIKRGWANRTVNLHLTPLRSIFKYAVNNGYATNNPAKDVDDLAQTIKDHPIPPEEKMEKLLAEAAKTKAGFQLVVWVQLRGATAVRPTESFHLEWQDVDLPNDRIFVRSKAGSPLKGGKFRVVEIHPSLKPILVEWRKVWQERMKKIGTPHDWVFFNPFHPERQAKGFTKGFRNARRKAGIPNFRSYDLRHLFVSKAIMSGVDTFTISKWTGHQSTRMIEQVYGHLTPEFRAKQMQKIDFGLGRNGNGSGNGNGAGQGKGEAKETAV